MFATHAHLGGCRVRQYTTERWLRCQVIVQANYIRVLYLLHLSLCTCLASTTVLWTLNDVTWRHFKGVIRTIFAVWRFTTVQLTVSKTTNSLEVIVAACGVYGITCVIITMVTTVSRQAIVIIRAGSFAEHCAAASDIQREASGRRQTRHHQYNQKYNCLRKYVSKIF